MGYIIKSIKNLPTTLNGYFFFLMGDKGHQYSHSSDILFNRFVEIAERIGVDSAIIQSSNYEDVYKEIDRCADKKKDWDDFNKIKDAIMFNEPGLIITKPHPYMFGFKKDELIAYISFSVLDLIYQDEYSLVNDIIALAQKEDLSIIKKAQSYEKGISFIERVGKSIILQPNINGIGVDIKEMIKSNKKMPSENIIHKIKAIIEKIQHKNTKRK